MTLRAENVSLQLGGRQALKTVSLEVSPGAVTALVGPNGAGKSSLLRILSRELKPCEGRVTLDGQPLHLFQVRELARLRSHMGQSAIIAFDFLVEEVLAMGWLGRREDFRPALLEVVARCDLGALLSQHFNRLSGGERQRVQFARALLQVWRRKETVPAEGGSSHTRLGRRCPDAGCEARYLLLDEPTANLDLRHELLALRLARRAREDNLGVLMVLHDLNLAARFADRVALMADGALISAGAPEEVFRDEALSGLYGTKVFVERHRRLNRLVVHT